MRARRALTEADRRAWQSYIEQVVTRPATPTMPKPPTTVQPSGAPPAPKPPPAPLEVGTAPGGIDRATWSRFRAGKLAPVRTLDLHGRTLQHAHADLNAFLARATAERLRCVEVITGRGSGQAGGAIRRELPLWLNGPALRPLVLAASHPHPANPGSVRLLLRRVR